jgi:glycerophosphoryl diester phosphodiesterase
VGYIVFMAEKKFKVDVWGHRGLGCTDSLFAIERNSKEAGSASPSVFLAENTLPSLLAALKNRLTRAVETDAVLSRDGHVMLTHSNDPRQHLVDPTANLNYDGRFLHQMDSAEIAQLKVGPRGYGHIATLDDLLKAKSLDGQTTEGMWLNLELKGTQQTKAPNNSRQLCDAVAHTLRANGSPFGQVRFSSFSASTLTLMRGMCHGAEFGQLFDLSPAMGGDVGRKIFHDGNEIYRPFDKRNVDEVREMMAGRLTSVHPEIRSLTPDMVEHCAKLGLSIATWAWRESSPKKDPAWKQAVQKAILMARRYDVPLAIITDHAAHMNEVVAETLRPRPGPSPSP